MMFIRASLWCNSRLTNYQNNKLNPNVTMIPFNENHVVKKSKRKKIHEAVLFVLFLFQCFIVQCAFEKAWCATAVAQLHDLQYCRASFSPSERKSTAWGCTHRSHLKWSKVFSSVLFHFDGENIHGFICEWYLVAFYSETLLILMWNEGRQHATAGYESPVLHTEEDGSVITLHLC